MKLNEIFYSIQGESSQAGRPCIFIRLTGCRLRCTYCDTKYAYFEGAEASIAEILQRIRDYPCSLVEVTGGEPMEQLDTPQLLQSLVEAGYEVMLETDGVENLATVPKEVRIIMDIKTPGSKMQNAKSEKNLAYLKPQDEVKFVICDEADYQFAREFVKKFELSERHQVLFSPVLPQANLEWLPNQILKDGLNVRYQLQLHKMVWGDKRGV